MLTDRTSPLIDLIVAALQADSYAVPDGAGGTEVVVRPNALTVLNQDLDGLDVDDPRVIGVYPVRETSEHSSASGGVMDRQLSIAVECATSFPGGEPPHRALGPLRAWVLIATHHSPALKAALREFPVEEYTDWTPPRSKAEERGPVTSCIIVLRLRHRTLYANPGVKR